MKLGFKSVHPVAAFTFFVFAFLFCLTAKHPASLAVGFICAAIYDVRLQDKKAVAFILRVVLPLIILVTVFNGLFSHYGVTILFVMKSGNNFTLEALIYGFVYAVRISAMLLWLDCFNEVITSDKFIFLFGRFSPRFALVVSMVLRFIPLIRAQSEEIAKAEKGIGNTVSSSRFTEKVSKAARRLSILVSWTLEKGIDTSDSMRARGYGLRSRTSYNSYIFSKKDIFVTAFSIAALLLTFLTVDSFSASYNPTIDISAPGLLSVISTVIFTSILLMPATLDLREEKRWSTLKSKT